MNVKLPFLLGVVEGFYGVYYTSPERNELIRFLGQHGFNQYIYGPKNDRQHRARWREAYPQQVMEAFSTTVKIAQASGVSFCYAISPGGSIGYTSESDFHHLTAKLSAFYEIGVRDFCLMMDDNQPGFSHPKDAETFASVAQAQAGLANCLYETLISQDPACMLSFVPAEYSGRAPFSLSLIELSRYLHPAINLCYTGNEICSPEITTKDIKQFEKAVGRQPVIWDNYPVNDLEMQPELHLGPITGRSAGLPAAAKGWVFNLMNQAEASKIPLLTIAAYFKDPDGYIPGSAWESAAAAVAGEQGAVSLRVLAETAVTSCLGQTGQRLDRLALAACQQIRQGSLTAVEVTALEDYLTEIDEAGYRLKFRMENLSLRNELLPWIEVLEHWMWMTRFALKVLRAIQQGSSYTSDLKRVLEYRDAIEKHPKRIATRSLLPLVDYAIAQAEEESRPVTQPLTFENISCLRN